MIPYHTRMTLPYHIRYVKMYGMLCYYRIYNIILELKHTCCNY